VVLVTDDNTLPISELFTDTLQGEGPAAGRAASFLRFMGCNLSCEWCDTKYTWDSTTHDLRAGTTWMTVEAITERLLNTHSGIVVLTGGEPLLQQEHPAWGKLLVALSGRRRIHIETNGTVAPTRTTLVAAEIITVSPKLPNAGAHRGHQDPTIRSEYVDLANNYPGLHLKIVCRTADDVLATARMAKSLHWPWDRVWVMPEGTTPIELAERWPIIAAAAARYGINATHRLHVLAWGNERGH
jgi:organic radical activating enzyme